MQILADLQLHSKYSRAVSSRMDLTEIATWCVKKGIDLVATGDWTHPLWFREIKNNLKEESPGIFSLKSDGKGELSKVRFLLSTEISSIYLQGQKQRRVHNLIFSPSIATCEKIIREMQRRGSNLMSDGRPIVGISSKDLLEMTLNIDPEALFIPAHAWTPWFSVFGSMSGFDSLEECFGKYTNKIFAIETGLSSDPAMNWRVKSLDKIAFISNSDSHSLQRIGREANVFDTELSYKGIMEAIKNGSPSKSSGRLSRFIETIEFFPEEGKYHYDGHRACGVVMAPLESKKLKDLCPKCGKKMTIGVVYRVDQLAEKDRPEGYKDLKRVPYKNLVTLDSIIGEALDVGKATKSVMREYEKLIKAFKSEFDVLLNVSIKEIASISKPEVAEGVERMRIGKLTIVPGYDGEFGVVKIFDDEDRKRISSQNGSF